MQLINAINRDHDKIVRNRENSYFLNSIVFQLTLTESSHTIHQIKIYFFIIRGENSTNSVKKIMIIVVYFMRC